VPGLQIDGGRCCHGGLEHDVDLLLLNGLILFG